MNQEFENVNNSEEIVSEEINEIAEETQEKKQLTGWKKELVEWIQSLGIAIIAALIIVNFVFSMVRVEGQSMEPTLQSKDFLFVFRLGYTPKNGDVVVFKPVGDPKKFYIKRVIATEGQTVNIINGNVYVDNELISEDYIQGRTFNVYNAKFPQTVPENCVFVLGDNREHSRDSRDPVGVGMVENKTIIGRALFRLFPFNNIGKI